MDNEQIGPPSKRAQKRLRDVLDVPMRVRHAGTMEPRGVAAGKTIIGGIEVRMLAGDDQRGSEIKGGEGTRKRGELDRFGPRADDQPDIRGPQISP